MQENNGRIRNNTGVSGGRETENLFGVALQISTCESGLVFFYFIYFFIFFKLLLFFLTRA